MCNSIKILIYHGSNIHVVSVMLQGRVRPKMKHKLRYFLWNPRAFWPSIDGNKTDTHFKAQKGIKDIVKIVHVTSVVQPEFYEATGILFVHKENKKNYSTIFSLQCQSSTHVLVYAGSEITLGQKYLNLCSEDERRSYRFGTTWGWVINDRIIIFGWTIPWSITDTTWIYLPWYTLKNALLNTTQRWVKHGRTQRLGYCPEGWVEHLTQLLVENNPACVLSNIYPALGCI